jgi:histidine triad (HIT) family protein
MFNHAKKGYVCPFCLLIKGIENEEVYSRQSDIVYRDAYLTAFIASHHLRNNPGSVLIIPNGHYENIYDMPDEILAKVNPLAKKISIVMRKAYPGCMGNVIRQHNEPIEGAKCKGQDVLHYHLHIIPQYTDDKMYEYAEDGPRYLMPQEERQCYASLLKSN